MLLFMLIAAHAADRTIAPGEDWCAAFNAASPGDTVTLAAGEHAGVCWLSASGEPDNPITLAGDGASIVYAGVSSNVTDVDASHIIISGLHFGPTSADIDAIKIHGGDDIVVTGCTFEAVGGISVSANSADTSSVSIIANTFTDLAATGLYLGCHDGSCTSTGFAIAANIFDGVTSSGVGYAMEIKLGSWGVIAENTVYDAQGPAIEVYGAEDDSWTIVTRNLLIASRDAATLEIGGGPAIVDNNVVIGGAGAALMVYDYGGRGLVRDVFVQGNTLWGVGGAAASLSGWSEGAPVYFQDNALGRDDGASSTLPETDGLTMINGNVDCADGAGCWADAAAGDLWPLAGGALDGTGGGADPALADDWCDHLRGTPPDVGALEVGSGAGLFVAGATAATLCTEDVVTDDTGEVGDDTSVDQAADSAEGTQTKLYGDCACAGAAAPGPLGLVMAVVALSRRSRRRDTLAQD